MKPTPERDLYDLREAIRYLTCWTAEDLTPHAEELLECADKLTWHVQRAQRGKAA